MGQRDGKSRLLLGKDVNEMYGNPYAGYQPNYMNGAMPDYLAYYRQQQQPQPQMQMQATAQPQPADNGLIWVQGEAGAKSYPVAPGKTVMLMDSENGVFYLKTVDASGMPLPLRVFEYTERSANGATAQNPSAQAPNGFDPENYITRQEFEAKMAEISSLTKDEK